MSEPSKEATGLAEDLWDQRDPAAIAAALQKLMDERDGANAGYCEPLEQMRQRAEAAEAQLADAERLWEQDRERLAKATAAAALEWKRTGEAQRKVTVVVDAVLGQLRMWLDMHESGLPAPSSAALRGLIAHLEALP